MSLPSRSLASEPQSSASREWRVPLSAPSFTAAETDAVLGALESGWWTQGPVTSLLEEEFAGFIGTRHAAAVSSGTAARARLLTLPLYPDLSREQVELVCASLSETVDEAFRAAG